MLRQPQGLSIVGDFMRNLCLTTGIALMVALFVGCSKHSSQPSSSLPANAKDLGVVTFTGAAPQHFALGEGKGCTVTGKQRFGKIEVDFVVEATNADGTVTVLGRPKILASADRQCVVSVGNVSIALTPKWNSP